jgi:hypothetical protein
MALLDTETANISEADRAANRVCPVTVKLTQDEHRQVAEHAVRLGQARSEWIRAAILVELQREGAQSQVDPILAEIVGVRLLLVNLLRPRDEHDALTTETFDLLVDEIKRVKKQVAIELNQKKEVW